MSSNEKTTAYSLMKKINSKNQYTKTKNKKKQDEKHVNFQRRQILFEFFSSYFAAHFRWIRQKNYNFQM